MLPIAWSAEFPNDNPLLHEGAVWICTTVRGAPRAVLRARPSVAPEPEPVVGTPEPEPVAAEPEPVVAAEPEPEPVVAAEPEPVVAAEPEPVVAAEPEPVVAAEPEPEPVVAAEPEPEPVAAPEPDPFQELVAAIAAVVLEAGATRAAAAVPALLGEAELSADAFSDGLEALQARGVVERGPGGLAPSAALAATSAAWRRVLRGELADLTDCGSATLDQWASELATALIGAPASRCDELRQKLRRRGVAAFGMLAAA